MRYPVAEIFVGRWGAFERYKGLLEIFVDFTRGLLFSKEGSRRSFLESYVFFIAIAWSYTVAFFFLGWVTGGSGAVGGIRVVAPDYQVSIRILIAIGFAAIGFLVWRAVKAREGGNGLESKTLRDRGSVSGSRLLLSAFTFAAVFAALWLAQDRAFALEGGWKLALQAGAAVMASVSIYLSSIPYIGFLLAATASYGHAVGIPILVAVPLTVAIASGASVIALIYAAFVLIVLAFSAYSSKNQISDSFAFAVIAFWFFMPLLNALHLEPAWSSVTLSCGDLQLPFSRYGSNPSLLSPPNHPPVAVWSKNQ